METGKVWPSIWRNGLNRKVAGMQVKIPEEDLLRVFATIDTGQRLEGVDHYDLIVKALRAQELVTSSSLGFHQEVVEIPEHLVDLFSEYSKLAADPTPVLNSPTEADQDGIRKAKAKPPKVKAVKVATQVEAKAPKAKVVNVKAVKVAKPPKVKAVKVKVVTKGGKPRRPHSHEIEQAKCALCGEEADSVEEVDELFGTRNMTGKIRVQSHCRVCRRKKPVSTRAERSVVMAEKRTTIMAVRAARKAERVSLRDLKAETKAAAKTQSAQAVA